MALALVRYRVMAYIVGVLLIVLICVGVPLKYLTMEGTDPQHLGEWITTYFGVAHGWLYMIFLVMALLLARQARWPLGFTLVTLILGTIPVLSFVGERRATGRARTQMAETVRRGAPAPRGG
ncbi:MAG: DUF3817 domain-containing protein [Propionibacteriales bacterium]|nr:DUF3817 domain-containing protein [Propionibacteriales bacterium]